MKKFPLNIVNLKKIGVEKWQHGIIWPVTIEEYENIVEELNSLVMNIISSSEIKNSFKVLYSHLTIGIAQLLHSRLVLKRLSDNDLEPYFVTSCEIGKKFFEEYWKIPIGLGRINKLIVGKDLPLIPSISQRLYDRLIAYYKNFIRNGFRNIFNNSDKYFYTFEYPNEEMLEYANTKGKRITLLPRSLFIPFNMKEINYNIFIEKSLVEYINGLKIIIKKYNIELNEEQLKDIKSILSNELFQISRLIENMRWKFKKRKSSTFLVLSIGNIYLRALCIAAIKEGHRVIGFTHGNNPGFFMSCTHTMVLMGAINTLISANLESNSLYIQAAKKYLIPYGIHLAVEPLVNNMYYKNLRNSMQDDRLPSKILNVMVIEDPITPNFQPWPFYIDFNIRKAILIKKIPSIKLILKRHPDRLTESQKLYDKYYDELIITPFEKVFNMADAFVFEDIRTTTFGFALFTKKPIIFFEHMMKYLWEEVMEPIRKRCTIIPSWYDSDGRILFDENKLVEALTVKPSIPNTELIENYFI